MHERFAAESNALPKDTESPDVWVIFVYGEFDSVC